MGLSSDNPHQQEEELFWVDAETGNIRIPAYAKAVGGVAGATSGGDGKQGLKEEGCDAEGGAEVKEVKEVKEVGSALVCASPWAGAPKMQRSKSRTVADALVITPHHLAALKEAGLKVPCRCACM
jgi:hypothetical protein